jgi:hypothetical protein
MIPLSDHKSGYGQTGFEKAGVFADAALGVKAQGVKKRTDTLGILREDLLGETLPLVPQQFMEPPEAGSMAVKTQMVNAQCMFKESPDPVPSKLALVCASAS